MIEQAIKERFLQAFDEIAYKQKLSKEELCKQFPNLSPSRLSQLRSSKPSAMVSLSHLSILVTKFGYSANWLLTGTEENKEDHKYDEVLSQLSKLNDNVGNVVIKLLEGLMDGKVVDKQTLRKWIKARN